MSLKTMLSATYLAVLAAVVLPLALMEWRTETTCADAVSEAQTGVLSGRIDQHLSKCVAAMQVTAAFARAVSPGNH